MDIILKVTLRKMSGVVTNIYKSVFNSSFSIPLNYVPKASIMLLILCHHVISILYKRFEFAECGHDENRLHATTSPNVNQCTTQTSIAYGKIFYTNRLLKLRKNNYFAIFSNYIDKIIVGNYT